MYIMSLSRCRFSVENKFAKVYNIMDCKFEEESGRMKKFMVWALVAVMCLGMLAGCGTSYATDESTVFVLKDGKIVSTDVEDFDEGTYDTDGLKDYVDQAIDTYSEENGKGLVKLKDLSVKDDKAVLTMEYASASDYQKFNEIELFTGSVAEALAAGYSFDADFASVSDGKIESCDSSAFLNDPDYKVVIIKGNTNVQVKGTIAFASIQNTTYVDSKTISIRDGASLLNSAVADTESTETGTEVVSPDTESATEVSGAVTDDDLLNMTEEETEKVFNFDRDETKDNGSEFSSVYTYIIYK